MYVPDFNNTFNRVFSVHTDSLGIDPLRDKMIPLLQQIKKFSYHDVVQAERAAPDLISFEEYGSEVFWWHIMAYNGICMYRDIVEGLTLKIPDYGSLIALNNEVQQFSNTQINTITI